jgi:ADP-dependent NAD(P)H-hydrate dehydratase / NAD(P)H-hydrate epimerase
VTGVPDDAAQRPTLGPNDAPIDRAYALKVLPRRGFGAHKWGVGGLVIVAGAPGFAGAAILSALAAGRSGVGIMNVATPRSLTGAVVVHVPEAATLALPEGEAVGNRKALELLEKKLGKSAALVVGPGLGEDESADALMRALFGGAAGRSRIGFGFGAPTSGEPGRESGIAQDAGKPMVIDADALNWLAKQPDWHALLPAGQAVLTPHVGEMAKLLGKASEEIRADPLATVREAAAAWGQTVVFKFGYTAVSDGTRTLVAEDAPPSLATAGAGDVLAGSIGAFLAQGLAPLDAGALAIHVGMRAARRVEERYGTLGLVAGDLPAAIAEELAALEREAGAGGAA